VTVARHLVMLIAGVVLAAHCFAREAAANPRADRSHPAPTSREFARCAKHAKGMRAMQHCDSQEVDFQQRQLDRAFAHLIATRPGDRERLEVGQAAWSQRKDAKCMVFSRRRGSLNSLKAMDCFREEIAKRRRELTKFARGERG